MRNYILFVVFSPIYVCKKCFYSHPSLESWCLKKSLAASLMAFSGVTRVKLTAAPRDKSVKERYQEEKGLNDGVFPSLNTSKWSETNIYFVKQYHIVVTSVHPTESFWSDSFYQTIGPVNETHSHTYMHVHKLRNSFAQTMKAA